MLLNDQDCKAIKKNKPETGKHVGLIEHLFGADSLKEWSGGLWNTIPGYRPTEDANGYMDFSEAAIRAYYLSHEARCWVSSDHGAVASIEVSAVSERGWPTYRTRVPVQRTHFDGLMGEAPIEGGHYVTDVHYQEYDHKTAACLSSAITPEVVSELFAAADVLSRGIRLEYDDAPAFTKEQTKVVHDVFTHLYAIAWAKQRKEEATA